MQKEEEILSLLEKKNVILNGHFKLSSGLHSERYVQCAKIFEDPFLSMKVIEVLAEKVLQKFKRDSFDAILSPAMGGILCGYELARQLLCRNIFVERVDNVFTLRRGFEVKKGERILLVEDVVTTGKSSLEAGKVVEEMGAVIIGCASVIDRRSEENDFKLPLVSVLKMDIKTYKPEELPPHLASIPWVKPGSRKQ
jgi:orotate phosphoribosyltransferase